MPSIPGSQVSAVRGAGQTTPITATTEATSSFSTAEDERGRAHQTVNEAFLMSGTFFDILFPIIRTPARVLLRTSGEGKEQLIVSEMELGSPGFGRDRGPRSKRKKRLGGQRKSLKRLNSAKRIQGNPRYYVVPVQSIFSAAPHLNGGGTHECSGRRWARFCH